MRRTLPSSRSEPAWSSAASAPEPLVALMMSPAAEAASPKAATATAASRALGVLVREWFLSYRPRLPQRPEGGDVTGAESESWPASGTSMTTARPLTAVLVTG